MKNFKLKSLFKLNIQPDHVDHKKTINNKDSNKKNSNNNDININNPISAHEITNIDITNNDINNNSTDKRDPSIWVPVIPWSVYLSKGR